MGLLRLWLFSIRDAFILLLPLVFFRSFLQVIRFFPLPGYDALMNGWLGSDWQLHLDWAISALLTVWIISLSGLLAMMVHQRMLIERRSEDYLSPLIVVLSALANFIFYLYVSGVLPNQFIDLGSMLSAIVSGLLTPFLFTLLVRWGVTARSSHWYRQDVLFYRAIRFTLLFVVATVISYSVILLAQSWSIFSNNPFSGVILWAKDQDSPIWFLSVIASFISQISWFFGIHGTMMLTTYFDTAFLATGTPYSEQGIWWPWFNAFLALGGTGSTLGLVFAILLCCKKGAQRKIAYLGLIPSLFNINEIILFGLPVVLNVVYLIPFLIVPILLSFISLSAVEFGWISFRMVDVSWTTPPLISGWLLTGSWRGVLLQCVELVVALLVYLPFVKMAEQKRRTSQSKHFEEAIESIIDHKQSLQRHDDVGLIARNLFLDLQQGLTSGSLSLVYQPKHDRVGKIVGVEALLRWNHEYFGAISPVVAIVLAEEGGFIDQLGDWVINEACACKARWNREKGCLLHKSTMAINLSPLQLLDEKLPSRIKTAMRRHGVRPREIEIEITESQSIPESPKVDETFRALSALGILLSIDDFGMGFASLRYLKRFNVDVIKIDGSLTKDVLDSVINKDIVKSITVLGKSRGIKVVAEFVETFDQRNLLRLLGCDVFQGYFHSAPLKEKELLSYVDHISLLRKGGESVEG